MKSDEVDFDGTRRHYDWGESSPTVAILESLSIHEYGDATHRGDVLDSPLHSSVETDALAALVRSESPATVTFTVSKYRVRIDRDGVCVTDADNADGAR